MANFTKVSDGGQIEIDWIALDLTVEQTDYLQAAVKPLLVRGHELVSVETTEDAIEIYLKDERYFDGEIIFGAYTKITYLTEGCDKIYFETFGKSDLEKFGYRKGVK